MSPQLLQQYDLFLDENDWDIYYWATQEPTPTSHETAEGGGEALATSNVQGKDVQAKDEVKRSWNRRMGTDRGHIQACLQACAVQVEGKRDSIALEASCEGEERRRCYGHRWRG